MTKYQKIKKMMSRTGLSKKECHDYLMRSGWDLEKAVDMYMLKDVDWQLFFDNLQKGIEAAKDALKALAEKLPDIINVISNQMIQTAKIIEEGRKEDGIEQRAEEKTQKMVG